MTFFKETININIENFICGHWGQVSFLELIKLGEKNIFTFEIYIFLRDIITFKLKNKKTPSPTINLICFKLLYKFIFHSTLCIIA